MRVAALSVGLILCSALLFADDRNVDFDSQVDFSKIKTFKIRDGKVDSSRPELNNSLVLSKIKDAIRAALTSRGLKETSDRPDVSVDFNVSDTEFSVGPFGVARPIGPSRGRGGAGRDPQSTDPVAFIEGSLVIDLNAGEPGTLIWRGVYRDNEKNNTKFAQKLPDDARKLLSEYPPKKK